MVPAHQRGCQPRGWQQRWSRHNGFWPTATTPRGDPHSCSSPVCRPPASLPPSGSPPGGSSPPGLGLLDRANPATTATPSAPAATPSATTSSTSTPSAVAAMPDRTMGYLSLSLVPILWGTYNPCIRYLYAEPDPLDPASLTAVRTLLSAGALLLPALVGYLVREGREAWRRNQARGQPQAAVDGPTDDAAAHHPPLGATLAAASDGAADGVASVAAAAEDEAAGSGAAGGGSGSGGLAVSGQSLFAAPLNGARLGPVLTRTFNSVVLGGLELGVLNFLGTALQVQGLHSTSATRAGFLAEVTAVLTPLVSYLAGYDIPPQMWLAVAVGLVGSTMVAYDTSQAHDSPAPAATTSAPAAAASAAPTGVPAAAAPPPAPAAALAPSAAVAASTTAASALQADAPGPAPSRQEGAEGYASAALHSGGVAGAVTSDPEGPSLSVARASLPSGPAGASSPEGGAPAMAPAGAVGSPAGDAAASAAALLQGPEAAAPLAADPAAAAAAAAATADGAGSAPAFLADAAAAAPVDSLATVTEELASSSAGAAPAAADATLLAAAADAAPPPAAADAADAAAAALQAASAADIASSPSAGFTEAATTAASAAAADAAADAAAAAGDVASLASAAAGTALEAVASSAADAASAAMAAAEAAATVSSATPLAITGGEAYLLLACLFYSTCTVRMGIYAPRMDTVSLAAMKKVGLSSMSVAWMAATNLQNGAALGSILSFPDLSSRTPISIAVLMYSGLGPGALATFLQVTGLSTVPATTAQVIYSITPLITAFFAYLILGGEATGPIAWAGGSLIIVAALMAADAQQKQMRQQHLQLQQQLDQQQQQQQH